MYGLIKITYSCKDKTALIIQRAEREPNPIASQEGRERPETIRGSACRPMNATKAGHGNLCDLHNASAAEEISFVKLFFEKCLTFVGACGIIIKSLGANAPGGHLGVAQLVARYLGVVEAASSSLVTQTRKSQMKLVFVWLFLI